VRLPCLSRFDEDAISTSYAERRNLTCRIQMRRLTRLTNAFSKNWKPLRPRVPCTSRTTIS